jgi:hypothetical protein
MFSRYEVTNRRDKYQAVVLRFRLYRGTEIQKGISMIGPLAPCLRSSVEILKVTVSAAYPQPLSFLNSFKRARLLKGQGNNPEFQIRRFTLRLPRIRTLQFLTTSTSAQESTPYSYVHQATTFRSWCLSTIRWFEVNTQSPQKPTSKATLIDFTVTRSALVHIVLCEYNPTDDR